MKYQRINVELIVFAEEADAVMAELNAAMDEMEKTHTIFGGGMEVSAIEHSGTRRKSALRRVLDAGETATSAVKSSAQKVAGAYKKVV